MNENLPEFVMRMNESHTLVDYKTQTSQELLEELEASEAFSRDVPPNLVFNIQVDTNAMNVQCGQLLQSNQKRLETKNTEHSDAWGATIQKALAQKRKVHTVQEERAKLVAKKADIQQTMRDNDNVRAPTQTNLTNTHNKVLI